MKISTYIRHFTEVKKTTRKFQLIPVTSEAVINLCNGLEIAMEQAGTKKKNFSSEKNYVTKLVYIFLWGAGSHQLKNSHRTTTLILSELWWAFIKPSFFQINLSKIFLGLLNCLKVRSFRLSFPLFKQKNTNPNPDLYLPYTPF